jgi:hypothetical protein
LEISEILKELKYNSGKFPEEALENAVEKRDEIIPELLNIIEQADINIEDILDDETYMAHVYAMFLLAQFREKRAYPLIVKFFSKPGNISMESVGDDVVTECLDRILASVSCGDTGLMKELAENPDLNEFIRDAGLIGLLKLFICGELSREELISYYKSLFEGKLEREGSSDISGMWGCLISCCCKLYPEELYDHIKKAFEDDIVDTFYISMNDVDNAIQRGKEKVLEETLKYNRGLIKNTIEELESWYCFEDRKNNITSSSIIDDNLKNFYHKDITTKSSGKSNKDKKRKNKQKKLSRKKNR